MRGRSSPRVRESLSRRCDVTGELPADITRRDLAFCESLYCALALEFGKNSFKLKDCLIQDQDLWAFFFSSKAHYSSQRSVQG